MKYLIAQRKDDAEQPVLFTAPLSHRAMADMLELEGYKILSAGFCRFERGATVTTHDRSESLNLGPRPQDAQLIGTFYRATLDSIALPHESTHLRPSHA